MPVRKIENPDSFRENIRKKLEDFFGPDGKKHAANLEKGIRLSPMLPANGSQMRGGEWDRAGRVAPNAPRAEHWPSG